VEGTTPNVTECIHGFDDGLCDICFPRIPVVKDDAGTTAARGRASATAARRSSARASAKTTTAPVSRHQAPIGPRRIYHVTHLNNLESILTEGAITAGAKPNFDLLAPDARVERDGIEVLPGTQLTEFVPFSLSPNATWWNDVRSGAHYSSWSAEARSVPATQYVVCDSDVSGSDPHFGVGPVAGASLLQRTLFADPDLLEPEVLAPRSYSIDDVVLLAVPNEPVRDKVKAMLKAAGGHAPKLAVYPPWFQPTDLDH
jgi:hypothetical protein